MPVILGISCQSFWGPHVSHFWDLMSVIFGTSCQSFLGLQVSHFWNLMQVIFGTTCQSFLGLYARHFWDLMPVIFGTLCQSFLGPRASHQMTPFFLYLRINECNWFMMFGRDSIFTEFHIQFSTPIQTINNKYFIIKLL